MYKNNPDSKSGGGGVGHAEAWQVVTCTLLVTLELRIGVNWLGGWVLHLADCKESGAWDSSRKTSLQPFNMRCQHVPVRSQLNNLTCVVFVSAEQVLYYSGVE